jgi:hypothetical protein
VQPDTEKVLRITAWESNYEPGITVVLLGRDLKKSISETLLTFDHPEVFITTDIFEMNGSPPLEEAVVAANRRLTPARELSERNQAILFYYYANMLKLVNPHGPLSGTRPAPLTADEIAYTLARLTKTKHYESQTVHVETAGGEVVELRAGEVHYG